MDFSYGLLFPSVGKREASNSETQYNRVTMSYSLSRRSSREREEKNNDRCIQSSLNQSEKGGQRDKRDFFIRAYFA